MKNISKLSREVLYAVVTLSFIFPLAPAGIVQTAAAQAAFEVWPDCGVRPPQELRFPLPAFAAGETPGFVDLGFAVDHAGAEWKALQFTRDKEIAATVPVGRYLRGLVGDDWPPDSVDVFTELHAGRLVGIEVDGTFVNVNPSCILDLSSADGEFAIYNVWPRFNTTGTHTLKYFWEQKRAFYFTHPFFTDDAFEGRRVLVQGEAAGNPVDGVMVLSYTLNVVESVED